MGLPSWQAHVAMQDITLSRRSLLAASLAGAAGFLAACGNDAPTTPGAASTPPPAAPPAHPGGTLRWRQPAAIATLDPHTGGFGTGFAASLLYDSPFRIRAGEPGLQTIEPHLAAAFEQPDPTTILLTLAPDATFQPLPPVDGRSVTPEDIVFSLRRVSTRQPEFTHNDLFTEILDVEVAGGREVRLRLRGAFAPLLRYLATPWAAVVPRELLELRGSLDRDAAGTGPYLLAGFDAGRIELQRNTAWWRRAPDGTGLPSIDAIALDPIAGGNDRFEALLAGETDWAPFVPFERVPELDGRAEFTRADYPLQDYQYVRLRSQLGPLRDVRVRRALAFATDRAALIERAYGGRGVPHAVLPPSVLPWAATAEALPYHRADPAQARQLLAAAGFDEGLRLSNLAPRDGGLQNALSRELALQWATVGVILTEQSLPYREYLDRTFAGNFQVNVHWGNRYDDLDGYVSEFATSGSRNFGGWGDAEVDALIAEQRRTMDPDERREKALELQTALAENAWAIGTASWLNTDAWTARLEASAASAEPYTQTRLLAGAWLRDAS